MTDSQPGLGRSKELDRKARLEAKKRLLRDELVRTYGCRRSDVDRIDTLLELFELRGRKLGELMRAPRP